MKPLYSVGTWDTAVSAYTPTKGLPFPWLNIDLWTLKRAMRWLRNNGYSVHRYRDDDGTHDDSDPSVFIERTDGMSRRKILEGWKR